MKTEADPWHCGITARPRKTHDVRSVVAQVRKERPELFTAEVPVTWGGRRKQGGGRAPVGAAR